MNTAMVRANAAVLLSTFLFGASVVTVRHIGGDVPPMLLAAARFGQGALVLFLLLLAVAPGNVRLSRVDLRPLIIVGALLYAAFPVLFNIGLRLTEASRGALMVATAPLWSAVIGRLFTSERLSGRQVTGIAVSLAGVGVLLLERGLDINANGRALLGDALMVCVAIIGAAANFLTKPLLTRNHPLAVTTFSMLVGVIVLLPFTLGEVVLVGQRPSIDGEIAWLVAFLGVFGGGFGYFLWTFGLVQLKPTQIMVYINLNPMTAAILAAALLGEQLDALFALAFALVAAGVVIVNWPHRASASVPAEDPVPA